ncbi:LOW QUALITY PROTEIN: kinesin-like protein Klp61F [Drosophila tropicalis]|uniref:LOW QUALITY PROTEIN: kinesin-like protein Klp61F n=1 Tax=Drosophila tropicalis TaxID=46794 RepID=UPI0035ABECD0
MDVTNGPNGSRQQPTTRKSNQNIQVYVRVRPLNPRERGIRSNEVVEVHSPREIITRHTVDSKLTKKFTFDRSFGQDSKQCEVYATVVSPLIEEVLNGYNCTVFAYGQTGTGKTHTMVGNECAELKSSWEDDTEIGMIPRALSHLFDELRMMEVEFTMRISYLELYNEELCDLLSTDDSIKIRIFDDSTKKGSVIIQGLEEIPVHSKDDVYKLLEKGKERRRTATTLMNAQSSRSHTVFSMVVHIRENGIDGDDMLKIGKLNLVDLAGSENVSKAGNEKGIRVRETVNINQSLLTLGRVITALVDRAPHVPYRESKLTRLLQESLGGRTKTSIIATISPGHKDIEETLSTLEYAHRAKNIQNKPEVNQKLTKKTVLKEYTEEIDKLKRDLMAARDKNGIYLAEETYNEIHLKMESQNKELNEKMLLLKALKDELQNKEKIFNEISMSLLTKTKALQKTKKVLTKTKRRYKEKKELLASHVKTEEELTNQAHQILDVANMATQDTNQLHYTIEKRRNVDEQIRNACDLFKERMQEHLDTIERNLCSFESQQINTNEKLTIELSKCKNVNQQIVANSTSSILTLKDFCQKALNDQYEFQSGEVSKIASSCDEHTQKLVQQMVEQVKQLELHLQEKIQDTLLELEKNNEHHKSSLDVMQEKFSEIIDQNDACLSKHVKQIVKQLDELNELNHIDAEQLQLIQTEFAAERKLAQQEEALMKQLHEVKQLRVEKLAGMCGRVSQLEKGRVAKQSIGEHTRADILSNQKLASAFSQTAKDELASQFEAVNVCLDQAIGKCSTLQVQAKNLHTEQTRQTEAHVEACQQHNKHLQDKFQHHGEFLKSSAEKHYRLLEQRNEEMQQTINNDFYTVNGTMMIVDMKATETKNQVTDHANNQRSQFQSCQELLDQFYQKEFKTYAPTGTTPSKRTFVYPRNLVCTLPHQDIVKRYRQEQDWSDLDTTAPIDELSDDDEDNQSLHSVQELSETETIMNSTPIEPDGVNTKRRNGKSTTNNNSLKPPRSSSSRNNSLSLSLTPSKLSPRSSPLYRQNNKENVA